MEPRALNALKQGYALYPFKPGSSTLELHAFHKQPNEMPGGGAPALDGVFCGWPQKCIRWPFTEFAIGDKGVPVLATGPATGPLGWVGTKSSFL